MILCSLPKKRLGTCKAHGCHVLKYTDYPAWCRKCSHFLWGHISPVSPLGLYENIQKFRLILKMQKMSLKINLAGSPVTHLMTLQWPFSICALGLSLYLQMFSVMIVQYMAPLSLSESSQFQLSIALCLVIHPQGELCEGPLAVSFYYLESVLSEEFVRQIAVQWLYYNGLSSLRFPSTEFSTPFCFSAAHFFHLKLSLYLIFLTLLLM